MESLKGQLLIAGPRLTEPNFARTVILVGEHNPHGALGVVLNRPSDTTVDEAVPDLAEVAEAGAAIHFGGPVQPTAVLVLAEYEDVGDAPQLVTGEVGFLALDDDGDPAVDGLRRTRVFAGYAGWGPGQLESELQRDDWIVASSLPEDVFDGEAETLWTRVLERQGGQFQLIARMPLDPSMN